MTKLKGFTKILGKLNALALIATGDAKRLTKNAGRIIEKRAKENLTGRHGHDKHIISGTLRASIDTGQPFSMGGGTYAVAIGTDVFYAPYVEARDKTGGFLRPALLEGATEARRYLATTIKGEIYSV